MQNDYRLGEWLVRPQRGSIERGDEVIHLKPKVMAVLDCLAAAGGKVVSRDDLFEKVWPGQVVSDAALTQCVVELRQAFRDSARHPQVIETIPKIGFRLIPAVGGEREESSADDGGKPERLPEPGRRRRTRKTGLLAGALVVLAVAVAWYLADTGEGPETGRDSSVTSLAVLPFTDVSPDGQQGWIAESLTEQLVSRLSRLKGLDVPGKTLSFTLEEGRADLKAVATELGVDFIVEGSVFRVEDDLRINTRLVEVASGDIWWSYEWTPPLENFLEIQGILTEGVAIALSIELDVGELGLDPMGPSDVEAFWSMDNAIRSLAADTRESWLEAVREIDNAVGRDPGYQQAWLWASFIYGMASTRIGDIVQRDWQALSEDALERAMQLAPEKPDVLSMLITQYRERGQYVKAEQVIDRLGSLESVSDPTLLFHVGLSRNHVGRSREAQVLLERARLLDPFQWAHFKRALGWAFLLNGRTDDALAMYESAWGNDDVLRSMGSSEGLITALVADDPGLLRTWLLRAQEFNEQGMLRLYQAMEAHLEDRPAAVAFLREAFENPYEDVYDSMIAIWAAYHGDFELAREAMLRDPNSWWIWHPLMAPVRNEPQIKDMFRELGLVEYWREYAWGDFCRPVGADDFECE